MYKPGQHYSMQKPYSSLTITKFPEDIECIIVSPDPHKGSLFISNIEAAENLVTLRKHHIAAVLSCAKGYELKHAPSSIPDYKYIPTLDKDECDISIHFDQAVDFISKNLAHTNVLVHCIAGVSRSVSMVLAYFIREHRMTYHQAYSLVKAKRKIIHPNDGFIRQLKAYCESRAKAQERGENSPAQKHTPTSNPPKHTLSQARNNRNESQLAQHQSVQLIDDAVKGKTQEKYISQYKSNQLTPKKPEYKEPVKYQYKPQNQTIYRTSTAFFTPNKTAYSHSTIELQRAYQPNTKTQNFNRYPADQKLQNAESAEQDKKQSVREQEKLVAKKEGWAQLPKAGEAGRKHQFEEMNKQLNQKIEQIRQKYDGQRKKLYERYQTGGKAYESVNSPYKKSTAADLSSDYNAAAQERKRVNLTVDSKNERRDDLKPYSARYDKSNPQFRDYNSIIQTKGDYTLIGQAKDRTTFAYSGVELRGGYKPAELGGYNGVEGLYSRKFDNIYTSSKGYSNDYRLQSNRFELGRVGGQATKGYAPYSRYNVDYSFRRY